MPKIDIDNYIEQSGMRKARLTHRVDDRETCIRPWRISAPIMSST